MHINLFKSLSALGFGKKLEAMLFPYLCVLCLKASDTTKDLCSVCDGTLPRLLLACRQCGNRLISFSDQPSGWICGHCLKNPPAYDFMMPLFEYAEPVDRFIHRLKFQKKLMYARLLGELMSEALLLRYQKQALPECIIPVPLHLERLRDRGFNQSLELAHPIAKKLNIPLEPFLYRRVKNTQQQSSIPIDQRKQNVKQAFVKQGNRRYQRVAILDDVVTTGFTVEALSCALKEEGVKEVTVWCCARVCR